MGFNFQKKQSLCPIQNRKIVNFWRSLCYSPHLCWTSPPPFFAPSGLEFLFALYILKYYWVTGQWSYWADMCAAFFFHLRTSETHFTLNDRPCSALRHWDEVKYSEVADFGFCKLDPADFVVYRWVIRPHVQAWLRWSERGIVNP